MEILMLLYDGVVEGCGRRESIAFQMKILSDFNKITIELQNCDQKIKNTQLSLTVNLF